MTENKLVIKINYDKSKKNKTTDESTPLEPKLITEWRMGRIIAVIVFLIPFLAGLAIYLFVEPRENQRVENVGTGKQQIEPEATKTETIPSEHLVVDKQVSASKSGAEVVDDASLKREQIIPQDTKKIKSVKSDNNVKPISQELVAENKTVIRQESQQMRNPVAEKIAKVFINDKRISRALLADSLINKEPGGEISSPIVAKRDQAIGVYFFTEINNMKGKVVYHQWFRNDKLAFNRKIKILGNRWRASTSKWITYSAKGKWTTKLIDDKGNILSEIQFEVI